MVKLIDVSFGKSLPKPGRGKWKLPRNALHKILTEDPTYAGRLKLNEAKNQVVFDGRPIRDVDYHELCVRILNDYHYGNIAEGELKDAILSVATLHKFDPVRDYLESLTWDGTFRLANLPKTVLDVAEDRAIYGRYCEIWFVNGAARVYEPGIKFDNILVFKGEQGTYKSSFFALMCEGAGREYFVDSMFAPGTKDGAELVNSAWIVEWAEFEDLLRKNSSGAIKAFLSSSVDKYRPAYARTAIEVKRRFVPCATTNENEIYKDTTGSRRYMTIPTGNINIALARELRDQLWAEAVARYKNGEKQYLNVEEARVQQDTNTRFAKGARVLTGVLSWTEASQELSHTDIQSMCDEFGTQEHTIYKYLRELGWSSKRKYMNGIQKRIWKREENKT